MSSPTIEALRPSLGFRAACPGLRLMRLVLKFVAFASSWPLGHPDYRTQVSAGERLRKAVYGRKTPEFAGAGRSAFIQDTEALVTNRSGNPFTVCKQIEATWGRIHFPDSFLVFLGLPQGSQIVHRFCTNATVFSVARRTKLNNSDCSET